LALEKEEWYVMDKEKTYDYHEGYERGWQQGYFEGYTAGLSGGMAIPEHGPHINLPDKVEVDDTNVIDITLLLRKNK
jgi:hypothetical protein